MELICLHDRIHKTVFFIKKCLDSEILFRESLLLLSQHLLLNLEPKPAPSSRSQNQHQNPHQSYEDTRDGVEGLRSNLKTAHWGVFEPFLFRPIITSVETNNQTQWTISADHHYRLLFKKHYGESVTSGDIRGIGVI